MFKDTSNTKKEIFVFLLLNSRVANLKYFQHIEGSYVCYLTKKKAKKDLE